MLSLSYLFIEATAHSGGRPHEEIDLVVPLPQDGRDRVAEDAARYVHGAALQLHIKLLAHTE